MRNAPGASRRSGRFPRLALACAAALAVVVVGCRAPEDTTAPTLELVGIADGAVVTRPEVTVAVMAWDDREVRAVSVETDHGFRDGCPNGDDATFTCGPIPLPEGATVATFQAVDRAGNAVARAIRLHRPVADDVPPELTVIGLSDGANVTVEAVRFTAVARDDGGIASVRYATDAGAEGACAHQDDDAYLCGPVPLPLGDTRITVDARDAAGNTATRTLTVARIPPPGPVPDTTPPSLALSGLEDGDVVTDSQVQLTATSSDDRSVPTVSYATDHGAVGTCGLVAGDDYLCGPIPVPLGETTITVTARDAADNVATAAVTVLRVEPADTTPPEVAFSGVADGDTFVDEQIVLTVIATDDDAVASVAFATDHGASGACDPVAADTYACGPIPLPEGDTIVTATATDVSGNDAAAAVTVRREAAPPAAGYDIEIVFYDEAFSTSQRAAFATAVDRWETLIVGDLEDVPVDLAAGGSCGRGEPAYAGTIDDLVIFATSFTEGVGGLLGSAGPCIYRDSGVDAGTMAVGLMRFDTMDLANLEATGNLVDVIVHEMAHVLGFGTAWEFPPYFDLLDYQASDPTASCRNAGGFLRDPSYVGANGIAGYDALGGTGAVPVEEEGGPGTQCGHWDEEVFGSELMTGYLNLGGSNPLSALSVRSLQDVGLTVDASKADPYTRPSGPALRAQDAYDLTAAERLLRPRGGVDPRTGRIELHHDPGGR